MTVSALARRYVAATVAALVLTACGGGGSDSPATSTPPTGTSATATFPLAAAIVNFLKEAKATPFSVTGTASGNGQALSVTGSGTSSEINTTGTFNGVPAIVKTIRVTGNLESRGTKIPLGDTTTTQYFDSSYKPLGALSSVGYCVTSAQTALPATIRIGDAGEYYTLNCYTNSAKTTLTDTSKVSYALEAATETTAILKLIFKSTTAGASTAPVASNYVISTNGALVRGESPILLTASGVTLDLIFKYQ